MYVREYLDRASNCVAMVMGNMNKYYRECYAVSKSIQICKLLIDIIFSNNVGFLLDICTTYDKICSCYNYYFINIFICVLSLQCCIVLDDTCIYLYLYQN